MSDTSSILNLFNSRRQVSYKFIVNEIDYKNDFLNSHYKLLNMLQSFQNIKITLEYVRRKATTDLETLGFDDTSNRYWYNGYIVDPIDSTILGDLANLTTGDKGFIQPNALGYFKNKDGQFAIYIGKDYNYNDVT